VDAEVVVGELEETEEEEGDKVDAEVVVGELRYAEAQLFPHGCS